MLMMWCGRVGADGLEPFSLLFLLLQFFFSPPRRQGHLSCAPCREEFDHHDLHLMSVAVAVSVAACSLREGVGVGGYLELSRTSKYFYPLTFMATASISDPLLHSATTFCLGFVAHIASIYVITGLSDL